MKSPIKNEALNWTRVILPVVIWLTLLYFSETGITFGWEAARKIPDTVFIYAVLVFVFTKWIWRWPIFQGWLISFSDLQGTWQGHLKSTWVDPTTGKKLDPIQLTVAIKQTFSTISCVLYTAESDSFSTAAQINEDNESGIQCLSYTYTNKPRATIRNRSAIHYGAAVLKIINKPQCALEGEYWTSRKTTGEISLTFTSKKIAESFLPSH